jgi:hypothetical protein
MSNDENQAEAYEDLYDYLNKVRYHATYVSKAIGVSEIGSTLWTALVLSVLTSMSDYCEVLTYYGDWHDHYTGEFQKNRVIMVVDRHKVISNQPNRFLFWQAPNIPRTMAETPR